MIKKSSLKNSPIKKKRRRIERSSYKKIIKWTALTFLKLSVVMAIMIVLSVSFIWIYNYLVSSPYLQLENIVFEGVNEEIGKDLVRSANLKKNVSIISVNLHEIKKSMEAHPWIRSVKLERRFPHTLIVSAEKQKPIAIVVRNNMYYLNQWGEIFKNVEDSEAVDFPLVTGISFEQESAIEELKIVYRVIKILENQRNPLSLKDLSEIHVNENRGISVYFAGLSAEIRLEPESFKNKISALRKVMSHLNRTGQIGKVDGIDLNYSKGIVVSFRSG